MNYEILLKPADTWTLAPFLLDMPYLDLFKCNLTDTNHCSESNYSVILDDFEKFPLFPYGVCAREKRNAFFENYSVHNDKLGFERKFKVYESNKTSNIRVSPTIENSQRYQRCINYNPTREYFKNYIKEQPSLGIGLQLFVQNKIDIEPVFKYIELIYETKKPFQTS